MKRIYRPDDGRITIAEAKQLISEASPIERFIDIAVEVGADGEAVPGGEVKAVEALHGRYDASLSVDFAAVCKKVGAEPLNVWRPLDGGYLGSEEDDRTFSLKHSEFVLVAEHYGATVVVGRDPQASQVAAARALAKLDGADPAYVAKWLDEEMGASIWWGLGNVTPEHAAMLLSGTNPDWDSPDPEGTTHADNVGPSDYRRMLRAFSDLGEDGARRPLKTWLQIARAKGLRHNEWILQWTAAMGYSVDTDLDASMEAEPASSEVSALVSAESGPPPLSTSEIAFCFDGIRWPEAEWKKPLGYPPKWLKACLVLPGERGSRPNFWNPVLIGAALVRDGFKANSVRARFQTKPALKPWLDAWKTYEAEHFEA